MVNSTNINKLLIFDNKVMFFGVFYAAIPAVRSIFYSMLRAVKGCRFHPG